jgi:DegV family protein with EDD domain
VLRPSPLAGLTPTAGAVERACGVILDQYPTERLPGAAGVDLHARELQQLRTVSAPLVIRHDAEVVHRIPVESDVAHGAIPHFKKVGMHQPITEHAPPTPDDRSNWIRMLRRRKEMGQCLLAGCTFQPGQQTSLVRTCATDPKPGLLILHRGIVQLHDVEQLVCNPVSSCQAAAAAREVGLLDAPRLGRIVFGADEKAVLAGSDHRDVVPLEAVAAEWVDDFDTLVCDLQPWMEPKPPHVQQRQCGQHKEQRREPERAVIPIDQVRQDRDDHAGGESESRHQDQSRRPGAPNATGLVVHQSSLCYRHDAAPPEVYYRPLATSYAEQMPGVAVVTDSTSSLDPSDAARADISIIPLQVVIDDLSRPESEVRPCEVAGALREGRQVSTSRPTPEVIANTYAQLAGAGYDAIVSVHLSSKISGTCHAAQVAAALVDVPIIVVDSMTLAMAVGFAVTTGAEVARSGAAPDEVVSAVRQRAAASTTYFYVDSLEYLRRGGRIGTAAAMLGSALAVKPLLTVADGEIRPYERVRTESKALARLEELSMAALERAVAANDLVDVAVHHLDNLDGARRLVDRLSGRVHVGAVVISEVSAVLGVHVGPGTLGIVVSPRI